MTDSANLQPADVLGLPGTREIWELFQAPGPEYFQDDGTVTTSVFVMLASSDGFIQRMEVEPAALPTDDLLQLVFAACLEPEQGTPRRPQAVLLENPELISALGTKLLEAEIRVRLGVAEVAREVVAGALASALAPDDSGRPATPDWLARQPVEEIKPFFKSAARFFRARPWEVVPMDRYLAFRIKQGDWHYANVMGGGGEEFGLATFGDWLTVCRFITTASMTYSHYDDGGVQAVLAAAGESEALTLCEPELISDADLSLIKRFQVRQIKGAYPIVKRFSAQGEVEPRFEPVIYGALLDLLAERAERAFERSTSSNITSITAMLDTPVGPVEVRYPARGTEQEPADDYWRIRVPLETGPIVDPTGEMVVLVEAPGEAKWHQVATAVARVAKKRKDVFPWIDQLFEFDTGFPLWLDQAPVKEPSPTVGQVATLKHVLIGNSSDQFPVEMEQITRPAKAVIRAWDTNESD